MLHTVTIDRHQSYVCPRKAGKGTGTAITATIVIHALVLGAFAAIGLHLVPDHSSAEVEASFTPNLADSPDSNLLESIARRPAQLLDSATEFQIGELPYHPAQLELPEVILPELETETPTKFTTDFVPSKIAITKQDTTTNQPPARSAKKTSSQPTIKPKAPQAKVTFTQAKVRKTSSPTYPQSARSKGQQGTAYVQLSINSSGNVTAATLSKSSGIAALDSSAVKAAAKWKFTPATKNGNPAPTSLVVPITFKLN